MRSQFSKSCHNLDHLSRCGNGIHKLILKGSTHLFNKDSSSSPLRDCDVIGWGAEWTEQTIGFPAYRQAGKALECGHL
jgi:hypothetical protein